MYVGIYVHGDLVPKEGGGAPVKRSVAMYLHGSDVQATVLASVRQSFLLPQSRHHGLGICPLACPCFARPSARGSWAGATFMDEGMVWAHVPAIPLSEELDESLVPFLYRQFLCMCYRLSLSAGLHSCSVFRAPHGKCARNQWDQL